MNLVDYIPNLKYVSTTRGGEWRGPCFGCGGVDRLIIHPNASNGSGLIYCRRCKTKGNGITYLMKYHEPKMDYYEAHAALGIQPNMDYQKPILKSSQEFIPKPASEPPNEIWQRKANIVSFYAHKYLLSGKGDAHRQYLSGRGIHLDSIKKMRLGAIPQSISYDSKSWGLDDGRKIYLPSGILIPNFKNGKIIRIRIRQDRPDVDKRYILVSGSSVEPMIINF